MEQSDRGGLPRGEGSAMEHKKRWECAALLSVNKIWWRLRECGGKRYKDKGEFLSPLSELNVCIEVVLQVIWSET